MQKQLSDSIHAGISEINMKHYSRSEKLAAITEFLESGLSMRSFTFSKDYTWWALSKWLKKYNSGNLFGLFSPAEKQAIICQLSVFESVSDKYEAMKHYGFKGGKSTMIGFIDRFHRGRPKMQKKEVKHQFMSPSMRLVMGIK